MTIEQDGTEACMLCGAPAFAIHSDGEVHAGYGSRHDTTSFVEIAPDGGGFPCPPGGGPICDGCIDGLLATGRLVAWSSLFGQRPGDLDAQTLSAVFLIGARRARRRIEQARAGTTGGADAALRTLSGAIELPRPDRAISISLVPEPPRRADPYAVGAATTLALAACLNPFAEADLAPLAREWADRVVRDRKARVDTLVMLASLGDRAREEGEG